LLITYPDVPPNPDPFNDYSLFPADQVKNNYFGPGDLHNRNGTPVTGSPSVNKFFSDMSFGKTGLIGKERVDGDVFGWYTMSGHSKDCLNTFRQDANTAES